MWESVGFCGNGVGMGIEISFPRQPWLLIMVRIIQGTYSMLNWAIKTISLVSTIFHLSR